MTTNHQHPKHSAPSAEPREAHQSTDVAAKAKLNPAVLAVLPTISPFLSKAQCTALVEGCRGEEGAFFSETIVALALLVTAMPVTYDQEGAGDEAIASLHYFNAGSDWYINEKDIDGGVTQAFGYAVLNGDTENAELGYISISELVANGAELDLYWMPKSLREIKANDRPTIGQRQGLRP